MRTKICKRCQKPKAMDDFHSTGRGNGTKQPNCKPCASAIAAAHQIQKKLCDTCKRPRLIHNYGEGATTCNDCLAVPTLVHTKLPHQQTIHGYAGSMGVTEV